MKKTCQCFLYSQVNGALRAPASRLRCGGSSPRPFSSGKPRRRPTESQRNVTNWASIRHFSPADRKTAPQSVHRSWCRATQPRAKKGTPRADRTPANQTNLKRHRTAHGAPYSQIEGEKLAALRLGRLHILRGWRY